MSLLTQNEEVAMLQKYIADGDEDLGAVTDLLGKVIESGAWSQFSTPTGKVVQHPSFQSFVTTTRWEGLGTTRDALTAWVGATNPELAERIATAWKQEVPIASSALGKPVQGKGSATPIRDHDADAILSRLKRDDPALAQEVVNGRVTANAAALQKGWRKPRIMLTSPESVAEQIWKHWAPEQIAALQNALSEMRTP